MKESTLIEMQNKINTLGSAMNGVLFELDQLKTLSVGSMELLKCMEGYDHALTVMKEKQEEAEKEKETKLEGLDGS